MSRFALSQAWFLTLAIIPLILFALLCRRRSPRAVPFPGFGFFPLQRGATGNAGWIFPVRCLALLLLVPVTAGLEYTGGKAVGARDSAVVIVLDTSSSMTADDFGPAGRLEEAKKHLRRYVSSMWLSELGLVVFAQSPRLLVPVTGNQDAVLNAIGSIQAVGYGEDGTAIGTALASAVNRLRASRAKDRRILLITDGVNNAGAVSPLDAARLARAFETRIDALGLGADAPSHIRVPTAEGPPSRVEAKIEIDDGTLEKTTRHTSGSYRRVRSSKELLDALLSLTDDPAGARLQSPEAAALPGKILVLSALCLIFLTFAVTAFVRPELPG